MSMVAVPFACQDERRAARDTREVRVSFSGAGSSYRWRRHPVNGEPGPELADARRRFDEVCDRLRPELHRFCTRMTGSPCDGEDVLQDALVLAFYRFSELRDGGSLRAWLFRIAHNKCIDFLRGQKHFEALDAHDVEEEAAMDDTLDHKQRVARTLTTIVTALPPRERACILLKDVLDWSLEETATITGASVGAVKAALHRGRAKLEQAAGDDPPPPRSAALAPQHRALVDRYLAAFNQRDWNAVFALLSDEARLEVVHRAEGPFRDASYFTNYGSLPWRWKLARVRVDGVEAIVHFRERDGAWRPHSIVQLTVAGDAITLVRDYVHVDYLLADCIVT
jgi:RNA polymerase sigma-70 factor (ECF subfamily)